MAYRTHRRSPVTLASVLVIILLVRLALNLIDLVLRLAVWLLLRLCWLLEAAIDRLTIRATLRPAAIVQNAPIRPLQPSVVLKAPTVTVRPTVHATHAVALPQPQADDVALLCKKLGRNDPETRKLAESMLASATRVKVTQ